MGEQQPKEPESKINRAIDILERSYIAGTSILIMDKASGTMITIDADAIPFFRQALSCPHPAPAPTDEQCRICSAAVARQAREDVLDNICHNCGGLADGAEQCNSCYVKSLRGERR